MRTGKNIKSILVKELKAFDHRGSGENWDPNLIDSKISEKINMDTEQLVENIWYHLYELFRNIT